MNAKNMNVKKIVSGINIGYEVMAMLLDMVIYAVRSVSPILAIIFVCWLMTALWQVVHIKPVYIQINGAAANLGTIKRIIVRDNYFVSSTIETTDGIFQVRGLVSAMNGDEAEIRVEKTFRETEVLCIKSKLKEIGNCYPLYK
jgi:hypothetical protein